MEILDLRHFSSVDLRPLLENEIGVWSQLLSWDYSGSADMIQRYIDAKILPGYAAIERGRIFGYSFFVYEGSKGVIGDLFVDNGGKPGNSYQVECQLLTHVIATLQQSPESTVSRRNCWCTRLAQWQGHFSTRDSNGIRDYSWFCH